MTGRMDGSERACTSPGPGQEGPFRISERARWSDVDAAGIVCYGAYLRFFELAETEFFRSIGMPATRLRDEFGIWLVRRRVECDFYQPVLLDEELEVSVLVERVGRTSITLGFLARKSLEGTHAAESRYALVAVDSRELTPIALPSELRNGCIMHPVGR